MSVVKQKRVLITAEVEVEYRGCFPFDKRREDYINEKLEMFVKEQLEPFLSVLRFSDEPAS